MGLPVVKGSSGERIQIDRKDMGRADSLRYNILASVVEENYDRAIAELNQFLNQDSAFPRFREKTERFIQHAIDLVNAIRAKRKFPGMNSLTAAKQQELNEKFHEHFKELQHVLMKVEKIQNDLKIEDVRSTVYVLKAVVNAGFAVAGLAFLLEISRGLFKTAWFVFDESFTMATDWFFNFFGW